MLLDNDPPERGNEDLEFGTWAASIQDDLDAAGHTGPDCDSWSAEDTGVLCSCGVLVPYSVLWGAVA